MTIAENFSPYTSFGSMQTVLKQIRKGWIPAKIDSGDLERIGVTKSIAGRTMATLEYLQLIHEDGRTNDNTWKAIATAGETEYPGVLEGILKNAYSHVFEIYPNPSDATDDQIGRAFLKSEPLMQRSRMISLFRGLCQEAGLIAGEPLTREQKPSSKKSSSKNDEEKKVNPEKTIFTPPAEKFNPALKWYKDLETLMSNLPKSDSLNGKPKWTKVERERWLTALQSMLDLLIEVDEQNKP